MTGFVVQGHIYNWLHPVSSIWMSVWAADDGVPLCSGELTALGNISSLHGLLGAGSLLLPQGPPLTQNPLTCLQVNTHLSRAAQTHTWAAPRRHTPEPRRADTHLSRAAQTHTWAAPRRHTPEPRRHTPEPRRADTHLSRAAQTLTWAAPRWHAPEPRRADGRLTVTRVSSVQAFIWSEIVKYY